MKRKLYDVGKKLECLDDLLRKNMVMNYCEMYLLFRLTF